MKEKEDNFDNEDNIWFDQLVKRFILKVNHPTFVYCSHQTSPIPKIQKPNVELKFITY